MLNANHIRYLEEIICTNAIHILQDSSSMWVCVCVCVSERERERERVLCIIIKMYMFLLQTLEH